MRTALVLLLALHAPLSARADRFGIPECSGPDLEEASKHSFIVCHSAGFKAPLWAIHEVSGDHPASRAAISRRTNFRRAWSLSMPGASSSGYRNSGYSRGHLVPSSDTAVTSERCVIRS